MDLCVVLFGPVAELCKLALLFFAPAAALRAEIVFLRKQLGMFAERGIQPRRATKREKLTLVLLARLFDWRDALLVVTPCTFVGWKREIDRHFWRWLSRRQGRPPLPQAMRDLVRRVARENPQWSCGLIARTIAIQLGAAVDEETVRKYLPLSDPRRRRRSPGDQTWRTFMKNQARAIAACDFVSVKTLGMHTLYIFVVMHIETRRILHVNLTAHPTAAWTSQQLREAIPNDSGIKHLVHDGAGMFNGAFKECARRLGVASVRTPPYAPQANAFCERLIGTIRRELLDWVIPLSENHLRVLLRDWAEHYNRARPHLSLGPGVPEPSDGRPAVKLAHRHQLPDDAQLVSTPVLGGLHHEYRFENIAA